MQLGEFMQLALAAPQGAPAGPAAAAPSLCIDPFEPDNSPAEAGLISANGATHSHTLHVPGDEDWISFDAEHGTVYTAPTFDLLLDTDTVLRLYGVDGATLLAVNPATNRIYITNAASNNVSVIDGWTNQVRMTIPVGLDPYGVAANPVTGLIYTANRAGSTLSLFYDGP